MSFKVSDFISQANAMNGVTRRTHFDMTFTLPPALQKYERMLPLVTVSCNAPQSSVLTSAVRRGTTNYSESFPYGVQFGDLSCSFLSDGDGNVMSMFNEWLRIIYPVTGNDRFLVAYRNEYVAPKAILRHYDPQGNVVLTYTFYDVFPEIVSDVSFSWGAFDDVVQLPVEFKYSYFTLTKKNDPATPATALSGSLAQQPAQRTSLPVTPAVAGAPTSFRPSGG